MNETVTTPQSTPETSAPKTISDPNLSFTDYERLRRGESLPESEHTPSAPEAKASEQKNTEASETPETEEQESEHETETESPESHESLEDTEQDAGKDEKPKKKTGFQKRINKLTQEREFWKAEALKRANAPTTPAPEKPADPAVKPAAAEGKPKADDFETHGEYVEALTDWKTKQALLEHSQKLEKSKLETEQKTVLKTFQERIDSFRAAHDDFEEMMENLADVPRSAALDQIITSSENGPELLYELAKDPKEAKRIATLPPLTAAVEIGKIQSRIAARTSEAKEPKKITQAPNPIAPVGGGKAPAAKKTPEEMTFAEYERYRREQMKRRSG